MPLFFAASLLFCLSLAAQAQFTPAPLPAAFNKFADSPRMHFGYIAVPENRANPANLRKIQLAVIVVPALSANPAPDPVFYIVGGPGGSATASSGGFPVFQKLNQNRDIVYLDPRGAGFSEPNLFMHRDPASIAKFTSANRTYFNNQGIDVTAFNTTEIAQDYETARTALGYGQINLFANSYGTFIAQELFRRYPGSLRCAVLSGNSPATDPFIPTSLVIEKSGIDELLDDVQRTLPARRAFPNIRNRFYKLVRTLNTEPLHLRLINTDTQKPEAVIIDGDEFLTTITELLQASRTIQFIPLLVKQFEDQNYASLVARFFAPYKESRRDNPFGMYLSVLGTDFAAPGYVKTSEKGLLRAKNPTLITTRGPGLYQLAQIIVSWNVPYNPGTTRTLPQSSVRTLFLNGRMDAQTPVTGGATIAAGMPNSINYIYPRIGHGVGFDNGPDLNAAVAFIQNPNIVPTYTTGSLKRQNFYKTHTTSAKTHSMDNWRDYLVDRPISALADGFGAGQ